MTNETHEQAMARIEKEFHERSRAETLGEVIDGQLQIATMLYIINNSMDYAHKELAWRILKPYLEPSNEKTPAQKES